MRAEGLVSKIASGYKVCVENGCYVSLLQTISTNVVVVYEG